MGRWGSYQWSVCGALLLITLSAGWSGVVSQENAARVAGVVSESASGAPVSAAEVRILERGLRVLSALDGSFVFPSVQPGTYTIRIDRIGYRVAEQRFVVGSDLVTLSIELTQAALELGEIIVSPGHFGVMGDALVRQQQTLTREDLETVPQIGEDVFRVLRSIPGVAVDDISTRLNVRGGSDQELLTLLDGLELYEPYHLKDFDGVFGIVDVQSVGGIDLLTGGFPVEYGDKLTGLMAMRSRTPPPTGTQTTAALSVSNASIMSRGGFSEGRGRWMLQARRGYLDLLLKLTDGDADDDEELSPSYYDVFGKVSYELGDRHSLSANVLHAGDDLTFSDTEGAVESAWSSSYAWLTWRAVFDRLSASTMAFGGGIDRRREGHIDEPGALRGPNLLQVDDRREFRFGGVKSDLRFDVGERLFLKVGGEVKGLDADYDYFNASRRVALLPTGEIGNAYDSVDVYLEPSGSESSAYFAARVRPVGAFTAEVGVRYDRISHTDDGDLSPRVLASLKLADNAVLRASWGRYLQSHGIHELEVGDGEEAFFASDRAEQIAAGIELRLGGGPNLRVEVYQRTVEDQRPRFLNADREIDPFPEAEGDRIRIDPGEGRAQGIEFFVDGDSGGRWGWSANYTLSRAEDRTEGVWVPRTLDQRHAFGVTAAYRPSPQWRLSATFQVHSGWPATESLFVADTLPDGSLVLARQVGEINGLRLPAYHRLDVRVSRNFDVGRGVLQGYLDVFNLTNRKNLRGFFFRPEITNGQIRVARYGGEELLPLLPTIGFRWSF